MSECSNVVKENKKQSWCVESRVCLGNYAKLLLTKVAYFQPLTSKVFIYWSV